MPLQSIRLLRHGGSLRRVTASKAYHTNYFLLKLTLRKALALLFLICELSLGRSDSGGEEASEAR